MRSLEGTGRQAFTLSVIDDTIRRGTTKLEGTHNWVEIGLRESGRLGVEEEA